MDETKTPTGKMKPFEDFDNSQHYVGEENKMSEDENNQGNDPFGEKPAEGKPENGDAVSDKGFGNGGSQDQMQNLDQEEPTEGLEDKVDEVSSSQVSEQAQQNVIIGETKKLLAKYMPNMNPNDYLSRDHDTKKLVNAADHIGLRLLEAEDITKMSVDQRKKHEKRIVRKAKWFDWIKKYIGVNPYQIQLKSRLKKAIKVKDLLDRNSQVFEEELKGRGYVSKNLDFYSDILEKLPDYVKEDKSFSSVMEYMKQNSNHAAEEGGLKGLFQQLKEKGRTCKDLRAMANANVLSYDKQMRNAKGKIDNITKQLNSEKNSNKRRKSIAKRMELNGEYTVYEREKDRWQQVHDYVLDDLAGLQAEYNITNHQIKLREATISTTKGALTDLNTGIKQLENFVKTKNDVVIIGEHIVNVNYARQMANLINLGGYMFGELTTILLGRMTDIMNGGMSDDLAGLAGQEIGTINDQINNMKREKVERFEKELENSFY